MNPLSRRELLRRAALFGATLPLLAACGKAAAPASPTAESKEAAKPAASEQATPEAPRWGYQGDEGPDHWADMDPEFSSCGSGQNQSPIGLSTQAPRGQTASIVFDYKPSQTNIVNTGQALRVDYDPGSSLILDGTPYQLLQYHFHIPSEHLVDGNQYPMEIHLVHRADDGSMAVVAGLFYGGVRNKPMVMASAGKNRVLDQIWQDFPPKGGHILGRDPINVMDLLPVDRRYLTYEGSLTTPPCTEGVRWIVLTTPAVIASAHADKFLAIIGANARPLQPANGRRVTSGYVSGPEASASAAG